MRDDSRLEKGGRIEYVEILEIEEKVQQNFWLIVLGVWGKSEESRMTPSFCPELQQEWSTINWGKLRWWKLERKKK